MVTIENFGKEMCAVALIGKNLLTTPGLMGPMGDSFSEKGINIYSATPGKNRLTFFVDEKNREEAVKTAEEVSKTSSAIQNVGVEKSVGLVLVDLSDESWDIPGILGQLTGALSQSGINIIDISSSGPEIMLFVKYEDAKNASDMLEQIYA